MKKLIGITALTAATIVGATEIWARGQIDCSMTKWNVYHLLSEIEERPFMPIDEALDYRYQYNTGDVGKPPLYNERWVSDGSWKEIVLEIWEEREPHYICQRSVVCKYDHRDMLGDRIEMMCERGDYRPAVLTIVKQQYARLTGDKS